jgi:hypothetical protein
MMYDDCARIERWLRHRLEDVRQRAIRIEPNDYARTGYIMALEHALEEIVRMAVEKAAPRTVK